MIDALNSTSSTAAAASAAGISGLGRDDFMTLLVTQLQHQDPLNPMQPHEFAAQLASFTSVDQLSQLNDGMAYQIQSTQMAAALSKTALSAALVGRTILAEGNRFHVGDGGASDLRVDVGGSGGDATLVILDSAGNEVATRDLGKLEKGRRTVDLPDDLPDGDYTYRVDVKDAEGNDVAVTTYVSGLVERVLFEGGSIQLRVAGTDVVLEDLVEIGPSTGGSGV